MSDFGSTGNPAGRCGSRGCVNFAARDSEGRALSYCDPCQRILAIESKLDSVLALLTNAVESGPRNLQTVGLELNAVQHAAVQQLEAKRQAREQNRDVVPV